MIDQRTSVGNLSYKQQEELLTALVSVERDRARRDVQILEFGCGFGRHARYLARVPGVRYHGYDFSAAMAQPLRDAPPDGMPPIEQWLFVGDSLAAMLGDRRFDLVFTVSVLIHNPPHEVRRILAELGGLLREGGVLVLVENKLVPHCLYDSDWHDGCWLHEYAGLFTGGWDIEIMQSVIDTHDAYICRPNDGGFVTCFRRPGLGAEPEAVSLGELLAMGLPKFKTWASGEVLVRWATLPGTTDRSRELQERLEIELETVRRQRALLDLGSCLANVRSQMTGSSAIHPEPAAPLPPTTRGGTVASESEGPAYLFDAPFDTRWAHQDARFSRVVHVFHQEWHGIRASAGYTPGHKIAIPVQHRLAPADFRQAVLDCQRVMARVVVVHGLSDNAEALVRLIRKQFGPALAIYGVWHGSTAQFHVDSELDVFRRLVDLKRQGFLKAIACVKPDLSLISDDLYPRPIYCLPPHLGEVAGPRQRMQGAALIPIPNDWRKNFYTNLYAISGHPRIETVYTTTEFRRLPDFEAGCKVVESPHMDRRTLLRLIGSVDLVLNASLSECQPMAALESLALGTPCLTGPLSLGHLDEHPYQKLVQVPGVDSVGQVRAAADRVLRMVEQSAGELAEMMGDCRNTLVPLALDRYAEFLSL